MAWANVTSGPSGDNDDSVIVSPQNSSVGDFLLDNSGFFCCCNVSYKFTFKTEMTYVHQQDSCRKTEMIVEEEGFVLKN